MTRNEALQVLGFDLSHTPTSDEVNQAYRTLSKKHHPDSPTGSAEEFGRIQSARAILLPNDDPLSEHSKEEARISGEAQELLDKAMNDIIEAIIVHKVENQRTYEQAMEMRNRSGLSVNAAHINIRPTRLIEFMDSLSNQFRQLYQDVVQKNASYSVKIQWYNHLMSDTKQEPDTIIRKMYISKLEGNIARETRNLESGNRQLRILEKAVGLINEHNAVGANQHQPQPQLMGHG